MIKNEKPAKKLLIFLSRFYCKGEPHWSIRRVSGTAMPIIDNLVVLATLFGVRIDEVIVLDGDVDIAISA